MGVTRLGSQRIYMNIAVGAAKHPDSEHGMYIVFTDRDNEEVHMFEMAFKDVDDYIALLQKTKTTHRLHVASANEMPR